jgi:hypothetical protein
LETISEDAYLRLREGATAIESDGHGEKVLRLRDGSYLKLFRRKRLISSAAWYPYAQRFADNAAALRQRGIPCPEVIGVFRIPSIRRDAVRYLPLAGTVLRHAIKSGTAPDRLPERLGGFVAALHAAGVYFRSLHLGNVVITPAGELGLIDIADLRAHDRLLRKGERRRNLERLRRDPDDQALFQGADGQLFEAAYAAGSGRSIAA